MNILLIGNGFDLAHGLPTKYTDFLEWVKAEYALYLDSDEDKALIDGGIKVNWAVKSYPSKISVKMIKNMEIQIEIWKCINNNFWLDYFLNNPMYQKENWIDFENEISKMVRSVDDDMLGKNFYGKIDILSNKYLNDNILYKGYDSLFKDENGERSGKQEITYKQLRDVMINDLNRLIRAFEIYLTEYIEKIKINVISPDIEEIAATIYDDRGQKGILFSKVISFNYTNIYEQIYLRKYNTDLNDYVDYIHGKADINHTIETNNMVLGIDEYLGKKKRNKQVEFIAFKKFYQRIHKGTGCKYKEWTDTIKEGYECYQTELDKSKTEKNIMNLKVAINKLKEQYLNSHRVYIFGHSLDVTDKDILRNLILNDNVHTTIFYHNKDVMGQQIANLVKVIGQGELIRRTGGKDRLIEFKLQKPMREIEEL